MTVCAAGAGEFAGAARPGAGRWLVPAMVGSVLLLQRVAIPAPGVGQVPLVVPLVALLAAIGLACRRLRIDRTLAVLLGCSLCALAISTAIAVLRGETPSLASVVLLVAIYVPAIVVARERDDVLRALRLVVDLMVVLAAIALMLFLLQLTGFTIPDVVARVLPASFVQQGFNTGDPITYGSTLIRSNGLVFLEPSIFSLMLGLAAAVSVTIQHRTAFVTLFLLAMATTLAGNGVVVLGCALIVSAVRPGGRQQLRQLGVPVLVALLFAFATPLGRVFADRAGEITRSNTSSSQRLVQPYTDLVPPWLADTSQVAVGLGAGAAQDLISAENPDSAVVVPVVPKLLVEYGVLGAVPMLTFLVGLLLRRSWQLPYGVGLALAYFVVNPALLQASLAITAYLFASTLSIRAASLQPRARARLGTHHLAASA